MNELNSKLTRWTLLSLWALLFVSAATWLMVGSVAYWVKRGWLPPDTSGWAQALGGLLAVAVAVSVPYYQNMQQRNERLERENQERLDGLRAARALVEHVLTLHRRILMELRASGTYYIRAADRKALSHECAQAAIMLRDIPVIALSNQMVHTMVTLRQFANYGEFAGSQLASLTGPSLDMSSVTGAVRDNIKKMKEIIAELDELELIECGLRWI